jgi:hypothetical protein
MSPGAGPELEFLLGEHPGFFHKIKQINNKTAIIIELRDVPVLPFPDFGRGSEPFDTSRDTECSVGDRPPR